jgi:hypothetical protein
VKSQTEIGNVSVQVTNSSSGASGGAGSPDDSLVLYYNEKAARAARVTHFWDVLKRIYKNTQDTGTPSSEIVLRTKPGNAPKLGPIIQTRSALGILKTGFSYKRFTIISPDEYALKIHHRMLTDCWAFPNEKPSDRGHYLLIIRSRIPPSRAYVTRFDPELDQVLSQDQNEHSQRGEYYYIADDDDKSKTTFTLVNLFHIVQATAAPPPLTPTISVGPSGG